jgi:hypothetical protein
MISIDPHLFFKVPQFGIVIAPEPEPIYTNVFALASYKSTVLLTNKLMKFSHVLASRQNEHWLALLLD